MNQAWKGKKAQPVPEIPEKPTWELFAGLDEVSQAAGTDHLLPVGYNAENAEIYSVDLSEIYCYLIAGAARTGKKNYLKIMMASARMKGSQICLIDGSERMNAYAGQEDICYISGVEELFTYFRDTLTPEFQRRNRIKQQILAEGGEEEELYEYTRKEQPVFLFISDMLWFMEAVYAAEGISRGMNRFLENLTAKGRYHNIYFVGVLDMEDKNAVRGYSAFTNFAAYKTGIHFGGNVSQNSFMRFDYLPFKEMTKTEKPGIGQLPESEGNDTTRKIVVPLMGKRKKTL